MNTQSPLFSPTRLFVPQNIFPIVNALTRAIGVQQWTDLGSGDGISVSLATQGIPLVNRTAVLLTSHTPPALSGWSIVNSEVRQWVHSPQGVSGDCVSMFDVIEHFDPQHADQLLDTLERSFRVVVIFTPRGFLKQDATTDANLKDDPLMWHRCGFTETDFANRGYLTFFWPVFHFPPTEPPHGAVLAIRVRGASHTEIQRLRSIALQEHRRSLLRTPALRLFGARLALRTIGGQKGLRLLTIRTVWGRRRRRLLPHAHRH